MKQNSTSNIQCSHQEQVSAVAPRLSTLAFVRQFARAYVTVKALPDSPAFVLN